MKKPELILLALLILFGFIVRLYKFSEPIADWHSFRQSDTAAVSRIFANEGYDFLYPKYYDISNVQSGIDNPKGYRFVEFPIYNFLHAFFYNSFGVLSFEQWGRLINIIATLFTGLIIYLLLKKYVSQFSAYFGLILFLFLPFSIYYSRVILPDVMMTTAIMSGIYFFDKYLEVKKDRTKKIMYYLLSLLFTAGSFLLKPFALFFTLPYLYLAFSHFGMKIFVQWSLYPFAFLSLTPLVLWRNWISQFPEGIPASSWLFNGNDIRFRPAFFRWIFFERITKLIFGYFGILFLIMSFFSLTKKNLFIISFGVSALLYLFVIATGNVQHDYYQIIVIPALCMGASLGANFLYKLLGKNLNKNIALVFMGLTLALSFYFSWEQVKDYFNINDRGMVEAAAKANEILPQDALIIAPYDGSTTLLNLSQRRGWPVFQTDIEVLIQRGAEYMVIANPTENDFSGFGTQYEIIDSSESYLILKLK